MKKSGAFWVAFGIFLSRIAGLIRERVFAHYFGNSSASDAFKAALRIPNILQNLFGEGVLSASFIPVYSELLAKEDEKESQKIASAIFNLMVLAMSFLVLFGVLLAPFLTDLVAPGFQGEQRTLTIHLVQIFFPGMGFLVLSAWCLGILNSHKKFFLSYFAPVIWNLTIILFLIYFGSDLLQEELAVKVAWGLVLGSFLQFLIQLPYSYLLIKKMTFHFYLKSKNTIIIIKNFVPIVFSRGVIQVSAYVDNLLASFLPTGAVSVLSYSQTLYLLPISLFGMSVSAAELPEMSQAQGSFEEVSNHLKKRLSSGLKRIVFFVIPSVVAFISLGDVIISAIFQTGEFDYNTTLYVWRVLMGSTVGLIAVTQGRLYSSAFYALKDARTPLKFALTRVSLGVALGILFSLYLPSYLNLDPSFGTIGIALASGIAGWLEFLLLKTALDRKIGRIPSKLKFHMKIWLSAFIASGLSLALKYGLSQWNWAFKSNLILNAFLILLLYGVSYFGLTALFGLEESRAVIKKVFRRR